eukprot:3029998-Pleurochrysis_carterae.AAC.3
MAVQSWRLERKQTLLEQVEITAINIAAESARQVVPRDQPDSTQFRRRFQSAEEPDRPRVISANVCR